MNLNLDCIRDILLEAEKCGYNEPLPVSTPEKRLPKYFNSDIQYNCLKLYEARYIDALCVHMDNLILPYIHEIRDITYIGHEFLSNIRVKNNWIKIKEIGAKSGAFGLGSAFQIASEVTASIIKQYLVLP